MTHGHAVSLDNLATAPELRLATSTAYNARMPKSVVIRASGSYVPERVMKNQDFTAFLDTSDEWIIERTGIKERHLAAPGQCNSDLALEASKRCLAQAGVDASEIDLIIVGTVTPDTVFPATANWLQGKLNNTKAWSFDINAGCSGFIYSLATANALLQSGHNRYALVVGSEKMTALCDMTNRDHCVLFGDAAACLLLEAVDEKENPQGYGIKTIYTVSDGAAAPSLVQHAGGSNQIPTHQSIAKHLHYIDMDGQVVYKAAVRRMSQSVEEVLKAAGKDAGDIDWFIAHQANARIIEATQRRLKVPAEKVYINVDRYGNTTAATIPLCLDELCHEGKLTPGMQVVLFTFGAGFTWGSCYLVWGSPGAAR
jgi:3-oxoacyl-[acyl-carrier-protein] synthase III